MSLLTALTSHLKSAFHHASHLPTASSWGRRFYHSDISRVPGLCFFPNFVNAMTQEQLLKNSLNLHQSIIPYRNIGEKVVTRTYLSQQHNLKSKEFYTAVLIKDEDGSDLNAQYFERYGEEGHELTYFQNNKNIPLFVKKELITAMERLREVQALISENAVNSKALNWKFTFNTYRPSKNNPKDLSGFPFHIDTPGNGKITAIFTLLAEAKLEMKKEEETTPSFSIQLTPGSLLLLSGESRWNWQHRVCPSKIPGTNFKKNLDQICRISLVLGCQ